MPIFWEVTSTGPKRLRFAVGTECATGWGQGRVGESVRMEQKAQRRCHRAKCCDRKEEEVREKEEGREGRGKR